MLIPKRPKLPETLADLDRPISATRVGLAVERGLRAFWPALTVLALALTALMFRVQDHLSRDLFLALFLSVGLLASILVALGVRRFVWPTRAEAIARLDATLPGRPLSALGDQMALGGNDPAANALWRAHLARMAERAAGAKPVGPRPDLAPRDPFALRMTGLTALVVALLFGAPQRMFDPVANPGAPAGSAEAAMGPSWEGWAEPPRYTGKPGLYLNRLDSDQIAVPEGTRFSFRFYGAADAIPFTESISSPAAAPIVQDETSDIRREDFEAMRSGVIELGGPNARRFEITVLADDAPEVELVGLAERRADGKMAQPFRALDDYAVMAGRARITLDLASVTRRYGLALDPEARDHLTFDLPMPISGSRADFTETLIEDASKHAWANLPVKLELEVEDGRGQVGRTEMSAFELPGRRFFDPLAAALIEARRDLLWSRENAPRVADWLRAISNRPDGFIRKDEVARLLRLTILRIEAADMTPETRDQIADVLWELALLVEDGGLADALEAMRQAQERLSEAIRNGASKDEIAKLMQELKEATDNYLRMLAERAQPEEGPQFGQQQPSQQITGNQIQEMMDEIQRLMEEGRMAEAQELLDQLARMMENLKVTQGQGGQGDMPGSQAMRDLGETLRDQQELSDDSFREMQEGFDPEDRPRSSPDLDQLGQQGQQGQQGQEPGQQGQAPGEGTDQGTPRDTPGDGREGQGQSQGQEQGLADRQRALRQELNRQQGLMPRLGGEAGEAARRSLDDAGRAMDEAERALREGDNGQAIDRQADAIQALREGMRALGEALAEEQSRQAGEQPGQQGEGQGEGLAQQGNRLLPRDPLGRQRGEGGRLGTEQEMLQGEDIYRRARDLLEELRRRSAERLRPEEELDYLRRLLDQF